MNSFVNDTIIDDKSTYKRYFYSFFFLHVISIFIIMLFFILLFVYKVGPYHQLYLYQVKKLNAQSEINTIFIGDSSLGNAINVNLFNKKSGLKSINLALTGLYGYSGSYNMIKRSTNKYSIKNIILVYSLDMMTRSVAYDGYLYSMNNFLDFIELNNNEKLSLLKTSINILFSFKNMQRVIWSYLFNKNRRYAIENDYIKQGLPIEIKNNLLDPLRLTINHEKIIFFEKIINICNQKHINLFYLHGPHINNIDQQSIIDIKNLNKFLQSTGIHLIEDVPLLSYEQIGDQIDHVLPSCKDTITIYYYNLLKKYL